MPSDHIAQHLFLVYVCIGINMLDDQNDIVAMIE